MNIYTEAGWLDSCAIIDRAQPFTFIIGGRGVGKTYGFLKETIYTRGEKIIYLRRTEQELEICMNEEYSPFRKLNADLGRDVRICKEGKIYLIKEDDKVLGSAVALSTVQKIRGMSADDVNYIIFDEFIRERNQRRTIKDEAGALFNLYETVNRNRELEGRPPVMCIALANANDLGNPFFITLDLVRVMEKGQRKGKYPLIHCDNARGLLLIDLGPSSPVSAAKQETALYKLTRGGDYAAMALKNEFSYNPKSRQASRPLKEYKPLVFVGEVGVYRHKSNGSMYVSLHQAGQAPRFEKNAVEIARFRKNFPWLYLAYLRDLLEFESYTAETLLTEYMTG